MTFACTQTLFFCLEVPYNRNWSCPTSHQCRFRVSLPPEGWGNFTGICQGFRVTLVRKLRSSGVSVWHSMAMIGSCGTCTWFVLPVVGQHFWSPFLETQIRPYPSALPAGGEETVAWWEKNRFQWSQRFNKKHNAWNCSQICWICTIIHAGSKWFSRLLPVKFIAPSSNQGACHSGWRAAGWTCWFGWGSGVMAADGLVGWCFRTNKSKRKNMEKQIIGNLQSPF